ncbi:hypothetical protein SCHPADRAFT_905493, partial [Schizopora paradoxa]
MNIPSFDSLVGTELSKVFEQLQTARYFSLAGLSILYYDLILTLSSELSKIWSLEVRLGRALRAAYFVDRYAAAAIQVLYLCVFPFPVADLTAKWCIGSGVIIVAWTLVIGLCGEGLVIYVICCSWDWRRRAVRSLVVGWVLVTLAATISLALCLRAFLKQGAITFIDTSHHYARPVRNAF